MHGTVKAMVMHALIHTQTMVKGWVDQMEHPASCCASLMTPNSLKSTGVASLKHTQLHAIHTYIHYTVDTNSTCLAQFRRLTHKSINEHTDFDCINPN